MDDLPYRVEYAKSGRASCKTCKGNIAKDTLRLAVMVQSPMFDGKVPNWYHQKCFFIKQRPKTVADIANFDAVRWEDQEKIKTAIENAGSGGGGPPDTGGKGGKKGKGKAKGGANDFTAEYAKSGRAVCRGCDEKILKDQVRISKKEFDSERARMYGPVDLWHHVDCFVKKRAELGFFESGDTIAGFGTLSADDKNMLKSKLKKIEVKRKAEDEPDCAPKKIKTEEEETVRKQSKAMFKYRDNLAKLLKKKELSYILEHNDQYMPTGDSKMLDVIVDGMTFGALEPCEVCKDGRLSYESGKGYKCHGNLTEWTKCTNIVKEPKRRPFKIPEELKNSFDFLNQYKFKGIQKRVWIDHGPSTAELTVKAENGSSMSTSGKPLEGMKFVIVGDKFGMDKKEMKNKIKELGGEVATKVEKNTAAVITTADHIGGTNKKIDAAKEHNIQCVSDDFLEEVEKGGALLMIQKKNLAPWGGDPQDRVHASKSSTKSKFESRFTKSMPDKQKIKLKGGAAVDPDSGLDDRAHVYQGGKKIYNCVLGMVDIVRGTNSYYKLQVLESDRKNMWWLFRSWGRIGTTIGNNKLENKEDLQDALAQFEGLYEEKTGNRFSAKEFNKVPGCWYPLDIDYGQEEEIVKKPTTGGSKSKLPKEVQEIDHVITVWITSLYFSFSNLKGGKKIYNCVLGMVDIVRGTNSYYKLQVLESDRKNMWWLFRSWGRIGTTIGNNKLENKEDLQDALAQFEGLYEEKTGNRFSAKEFNKVPGCWYPLDIDYGQEEEIVKKPTTGGSKSKLPKEVQELVALIFDVDTMKSALVEFEIDVKKMPLGKLSKKQIESAYKVLSEALKLIADKQDTKDDASSSSPTSSSSSSSSNQAKIKAQLLDCSNRFFTLIPHDFGMKKPPILDDLELIKVRGAFWMRFEHMASTKRFCTELQNEINSLSITTGQDHDAGYIPKDIRAL
ncbi:poly [ADP-ribose] polymerase 1-like [Penaeus indicus]|uniref:poly [ADP-ribose] polymerase 1-like n=1 Tax=Penaeus indicus TaxID=29960 RepID=UPI00300C6150